MLLGYFMNAAIDQNCEKYIIENGLEKEIDKKIDPYIKVKTDHLIKEVFQREMMD